MRTLSVDLGDRSYPVYIGSGLLGQAELRLKEHEPDARGIERRWLKVERVPRHRLRDEEAPHG